MPSWIGLAFYIVYDTWIAILDWNNPLYWYKDTDEFVETNSFLLKQK